MRIGLTTHTFIPEFIGGRECHVDALARVLGRRHDVFVFAGSLSDRVVVEEKEFYTLYRIPLKSFPVSSNPRQYYRLIPGFHKVMSKVDLDVVHAHEYRHFSTDVAARYCRRTRTPLVLTVHGYQVTNAVGGAVVRLYDRFIGPYSLKTASRIVCVSNIQVRDLACWSHLDLAEKIRVIPNGVFVDEFNGLSADAGLLEKHCFDGNRIVLSVGRLLYRKGFHDLVNASGRIVSENPDVKVMILGPDHGEQVNLEKMIIKRGLEDSVLLFGPASSEVVKHFLSLCDVFAIPSLYEGLPTTLLEAMACGKPVVGSDIESIAEVVSDGVDGLLVSPGSPDELAQSVNRLLSDAKLSSRLGRAAKKSVGKYDWNSITRDIVGVYEECVRK